MYKISFTNKFKKDYKLCKKRGLDISKLEEVVDLLHRNGKLPSKYKPHILKGNYMQKSSSAGKMAGGGLGLAAGAAAAPFSLRLFAIKTPFLFVACYGCLRRSKTLAPQK